ncbi:MAG: glycosyltransferase [Planctomycetota bacterium]
MIEPRRPYLTILLATFNEAGNIADVIESIRRAIASTTDDYEILVVDAGSPDGTQEIAARSGARVLVQQRRGYGAALAEGLAAAHGENIVTLDADRSHDPFYIPALLRALRHADVAIGSRYVRFAFADMPWIRKALSKTLNVAFARFLDLPFRDISSGYRAYRRRALEGLELRGTNYEVLEELLVKIHAHGHRIVEVPIHYHPRGEGSSKVRWLAFGWSFSRALIRLWKLRNSVYSADYDERAFYSLVLPQRMWQRKRYRVIHALLDKRGPILDVGCGSSMIAMSLPQSVGLDIQLKKLRYLRQLGLDLIRGSIRKLPFEDRSFDEVICSQVIEHIPPEWFDLREFSRVLSDDGVLVLGTPDYARKSWLFTEWVYGKVMPGAYADEHITHYTRASLEAQLRAHGFEIEAVRYVYMGELVIRARKRTPQPPAPVTAAAGAESPAVTSGST